MEQITRIGRKNRCLVPNHPCKPIFRVIRHSDCLLLVLSLALLSGCGRHSDSNISNSPPPAPVVTFADVTAKAGISFRHVNGATGKKWLPETMGSGCAFLDYDNDGWQDILLING